MLDRNREELIATVRGLAETDARRRLVASLTTPISLIKHAAGAERIWFQRFWGGLDESECDGYSRRDEGTFAVADDEALADVIAEFERASQRSREIASHFDLCDTKDNPREGPSACDGHCSPSSKSSPVAQVMPTSSARSSIGRQALLARPPLRGCSGWKRPSGGGLVMPNIFCARVRRRNVRSPRWDNE